MQRQFNGLRRNNKMFLKRSDTNNCYTYAINQYKGNRGSVYDCTDGCQMGGLNDPNRVNWNYNSWEEYLVDIIDRINEDLSTSNMQIRPSTYEEYIDNPNAWKVAFCHDSNIRGDYHWYRQDARGTWSHKRGFGSSLSNKDDSGKVIYNPTQCNRGRYKRFLGFYMIEPKKKEEKYDYKNN